ncbi:hypothetical protein Tco_1152268 [Tanacetum coccineum]
MLDKPQYESWKSHMELYIQGKDHGRIILNSVENVPLIWPTVAQEDGTVRLKTYEELSDKEKLQANCDLKATNIVLQGTSLSKQERECKLYDEFDKFFYVKGETLHQYYLRFAQLINDMNIIQMTMQPVQVNTKFLNCLPPEWGKFVTDIKLARDLHTSNYDQLHAYLEQHEGNVNSGSVEKDTHVPDLCALEKLARNAYQEAEKQQIFAQKVQKQNMHLTSQLEMYKERVRILENIKKDNNYLNEFLEADERAKRYNKQAQS